MKKRRNNQELGRLLRQYEPSRQMVESDRFWSVFRARAEQQSQPNQGKEHQRRLWQLDWRFSTVAALVLLVFSLYTLLSTFFSHPSPDPRQAPSITLVEENDDIAKPDELPEAGGRRMEPSPEPPSADIPMFTARDDRDNSSKPVERRSRAPAPMRLAEQEAAFSPSDTDLSKVEEVEVAIDYSGLLILRDEEHGGTFILLALTD